MLRNIFRRKEAPLPPGPTVDGHVARVPPGVCIYAIGDIHGRADLLGVLRRQIEEDAQQLTPGTERIVVYMGDYVDRGLESAEVIDALIRHPLEGFRSIHLLGNHDAWLLSFLVDPQVGATWLRYGGDVTLHSYGVRLGTPVDDAEYLVSLQAALRQRLPRSHVDFLRSLELSFESGDFLFVHAGVRPGVAVDRQTADDLLWIREPFLSFDRSFGKVVVHGHTVESEPVVRHNRIGIDTGACWTGRLTCLVLEEGTHRFLSTLRSGEHDFV
ncbi:MAG: metallophosphoesterase family protein [Geminicoccaceae bacterium]|nr:metallophosphoesterase family protein [Geminicoccaceae bacterium]